MPGSWAALAEHDFDFFKGLSTGFGIGEEGLHSGAEAEHAEDDECLVGDIGKGRGDKESKGEVKEPVSYCCQSHTCCTGLEGPDFGGVDPGYRGKSEGVDDNKEIAEGDDGVGRRASDANDDVQIALYTTGNVLAVSSEDAANDELTDAHADGTVDKERTTTGLVDEEEDARGEDDEKGILHARRDQVNVAGKAGHLEDVDDVVGHDVSTGHLLPLSHVN